ncbi:MAG: cysteine desulfurase [Bdellovibrionales bacterium]|nr:cysteine desulfurase [Bdellovibrionales bacterium]
MANVTEPRFDSTHTSPHLHSYFDYNATTPMDTRVLEAMLPYFCKEFGNASSDNHRFGWQARSAVERARSHVARLIDASPEEVFFTSGATESINMVLQGVVEEFMDSDDPIHIITTNAEHKATINTCQALSGRGIEITYLPVNRYGQVQPDQVSAALRPHTRLVSIIMANNEIGSINPVDEIGKVVKNCNVLYHLDAAQAVGKMPLRVSDLDVDFVSISGHKIYGPKGIGALYKKSDAPLKPIIFGGTQEFGLRPGTLNVPAIVGLGRACEIYQHEQHQESSRITQLRDRLIQKILSEVPKARLNGHPTLRLCNNASFAFQGVSPEIISQHLRNFAISSSSACNSACTEPSHVLQAIGLPEDLARSTIRIGLGRETSVQDVDALAAAIVQMPHPQ